MHTKTVGRHKHDFGATGMARYCLICHLSKSEIRERAENARQRAAKATAMRQAQIREMQEKGIWPGLSGKIETRERPENEENISAKSLDKEFPF